MVRRSICILLLAAVAAVVVGTLDLGTASEAQAGVPYHVRDANDLFYNYYVPPGPYGGVGAQLYPSPLPVPPLVGHTCVTYQPLLPHEFLHQHGRTYLRYHPNGGCTRTCVTWY